MTEFFMERLDPDHPLNRAAREMDDLATGDGLTEALAKIELDVPPQQIAYFAHQRAIRHEAAKEFSQRLNLSDDDQVTLLRILMVANIDSLAIGWRAAQLQGPNLLHVHKDRR